MGKQLLYGPMGWCHGGPSSGIEKAAASPTEVEGDTILRPNTAVHHTATTHIVKQRLVVLPECGSLHRAWVQACSEHQLSQFVRWLRKPEHNLLRNAWTRSAQIKQAGSDPHLGCPSRGSRGIDPRITYTRYSNVHFMCDQGHIDSNILDYDNCYSLTRTVTCIRGSELRPIGHASYSAQG